MAAHAGPVAGAGLLALAALALSLIPAAARACPPPAGFDAQGRIESSSAVVLYRTAPPAIEVGQLFTVEAVVCPGGPAAVALVHVDARMPDHRHGMNYRPRVMARGDGRYVAEGLLFHMPGRWQLLFELQGGGRTEHLAADLVVE